LFGLKRWRHERLRRRPLPGEWREILERNVPLYRRLPPADRAELEGHLQVFLAEKRFEGCGGLELTDEIRVTVAAHACLLLLHRDTDYYPTLRSILIYPTAYLAPARERLEGGVVQEGRSVRLGESWHHGLVVLSWDDVLRGAADPHDSDNVALHEFVHQLDEEDGAADGAPRLPSRARYAAWARVLGAEYERLQQETAYGRPTLIDGYGATAPAEFFAVASECFFEKPVALRRRHPELYQQLREFYRQDPAELDRD